MRPYCHEIFLQDHPTFIRFYSPDHHSEKIDIPKEFNENFKGSIPENFTFKSLGGKVWEAKVEDIDGVVHFAKGWEQYAQDNDLKLGDVLMFKYLQNDSADFYVIAFGENGAIKDVPAEERNDDDTSSQSSAKETPSDSAEDTNADSEGESVGESTDDLVFVRHFKIGFMSSVGVPKHVLKSCVLELPQKVKLQYEMGIGVTTKLRQATESQVCIGYKRLSKFWRANGTKNGDRLEFRLILGSENKIEKIVVRKIGSHRGNDDGGRQPTDVHFTEAGTIKFYKRFNAKFKNMVGIPVLVIDACTITPPQTVKLTNDRGRGIQIPLRKTASRYVLGYSGLIRFWRKNGVQEGDKLEFEVIRGSGNKIKKIIMRNKTKPKSFNQSYA